MAGDPRPRPHFAAAGGFTPQAIHLSPLRGSDRASEGTHREFGGFASKRVMLAMERRLRIPLMLMMSAMERRRRGRYLAWGVSPGVAESNSKRAPGGGDR